MAMNLIDESIALDSTYMLAYQTKARFLKGQNQYKEALEVINLAFQHHLEKDNPVLFLNRAILYENLNLTELAKTDYNAALPHYDQWIKKHPNDYNALNMRAMVIFLYKGKEAGIQTYEKLLDKPLNDIEREEIKIFMREIKNKSRKEIINSIN
jgi:tetratricopeptide (TPR) repeat protein